MQLSTKELPIEGLVAGKLVFFRSKCHPCQPNSSLAQHKGAILEDFGLDQNVDDNALWNFVFSEMSSASRKKHGENVTLLFLEPII